MTTDRPHRRLAARGWLALPLAALLALALLPGPAAGASSPYHLDLGARADFVPQTNFVQCVGASMQMMLNMIKPGRDRTARTQLELQRLARAWSGQRPDGREREGASVRGWTTGLNMLGAGPYRLVGATSLEAAMQVAARAMRRTGKPVGLLVWRGRHAWVMSGFRATADPLTGGRVTRAIVEDPLYPHGSSVWGPSPKPGALLTLKEVGRQFVPRNRSARAGTLGGRYVLVLPVEWDLRTLRMM